ncbi:VOC family protein [Chloroflexota bacterium]
MDIARTQKLPFSEINQVGIVVKDLKKAEEFYSSLGIGPFFGRPKGVPPNTNKILRGKPADFQMDIRFARMGSLELELIQPLSQDHPYKDFVEKNGEGLHHLGFFVDDIDAEEARLVKQGFKVLASGRRPIGGFTYFEPDIPGGVCLELVQRQPDFWDLD